MLGVITALREEAQCLRYGRYELQKIKQLSNNVAIVVAGVNLHHAGAAAQLLIDAGAKALVSFGTVGALSHEVVPGTLCIPETVVNENNQTFYVDETWRNRLLKMVPERLSLYTKSLLSVSQIIENPVAKEFSAKKFAANVVDMESSAIGLIASKHHLPFLVIRAVVDPISFIFPPCVLHSITATGEFAYLNLLRILLKRPQDAIACYQLQRYFHRATKTLKQIVKASDRQLGWI